MRTPGDCPGRLLPNNLMLQPQLSGSIDFDSWLRLEVPGNNEKNKFGADVTRDSGSYATALEGMKKCYAPVELLSKWAGQPVNIAN